MLGKRYGKEKKTIGEHTGNQHTKKVEEDHFDPFPKLTTAEKIAEQAKVGTATVKRAEKFAKAVDIIAENTGIASQHLLSGNIKATKKDIQTISMASHEKQKEIIAKLEPGITF